MTPRRLKMKSIIAVSLAILLGACGSASKNYKVWYLEPAQGLVRKQEAQVLPFPKAKGYLCANPGDFSAVTTCLQAETKIYYLEPSRGLVRKQAGEVRSFQSSRGFLCVSPDDYQGIREDCAQKENKNES